MVDGSWMVIIFLLFLEYIILIIIIFCSVISVFNVTGQDGNKVTDEVILDYIRKVKVFLILCFFELSCSLMYKITNCLVPFMDLVSWS